MPEVWCTLKRSLSCSKSFLCDDVHEPEPIRDSNSKERTERDSSGCLRSKSNLRDIICGSKRHSQKPSPRSSSRSLAMSEVLHTMIHEIESQIKRDNFFVPHEEKPRLKLHKISVTRNSHAYSATSHSQFNDGYELICQECGGVFKNSDALESHHLSKHAVRELLQGDSSRRVIELICKRNWHMSKSHHIEKVFKVHSSPRTQSLFEVYREMVKTKARELENENPRCLVDGNELLRFYGTTIACSLSAADGSQILCNLVNCGVCQILRHGFNGAFTCATSGKAFEGIAMNEDVRLRKALMVCRVIAGRIEEDEESDNSGLDLSGGKTGRSSKREELYVFDSKAVLPCFVLTFKR
ncbi:hypothetical protein IC582_017955 [Cucumis melo]|uniref:Uncharacterized protein LOC103484579 n=2 Tax=Cucumis melo TaxID=3656 RepID=A0A1S3B0L1_CUCME|nr:uncharacterized protein LOC103484579 [Cucumis melo]KAA0052745.1 Zinc finger, C2H2 [Cucumis melo var. makuwa]TYK13078.1 Zinc finger, C2H2 [Cucumis melo var. makuwa]